MQETQGYNIDRTAAKKYFKGSGIWPKLFLLIGFGLCFLVLPLGILIIIISLIWLFLAHSSAIAYERQVDQIIAYEQENLLQRGFRKMNIVGEQVQLIPPIKTVGMSYQPVLISEGKVGFFSALRNKFKGNAPVLVSRVGSDDRWRFSLIQVNIFMFSESQLYVYFAHIDVTTGLIFHEGTHEYFYKDICGVTSEQRLESKFNVKKKRFQNVVLEFINLYTPGCNHLAGFDTSMTGSVLDEQFSAMRNLIREKKA